MNLVQTNKHNAADDIRSDPDALKAIGDKTWKIYGPPGTGKTWTLLNIIKYGIGKKHIVPEYIGYCSYTRAAAKEGIDRVLEKFKGVYKEDSFECFKTIHSLCLSRTRDSSLEIMDEYKHVPAFQYLEKGEQVELQIEKDDDNKPVIKNYPIQLYEKARNCKIGLKEAYDADTSYQKTKSWRDLVDIVNNWVKFKEGMFMDFTDMVEDFLIKDYSFKLDYFIVDEAQDLTPLQWDFVYLMAMKADKVFIAGDDDQAIHEWNGASVEEFLKFPGRKKVLRKSRRLPKEVLKFATNITRLIKTREPKDFISTGSKGYVNTNNYRLSHINFNEHQEDSWMVLGRTKSELIELRNDAKEMGLFFKNSAGYPSVNATHWKAIHIWNTLMKDESITINDVSLVYDFIKDIKHGWRKTNNKKWSGISKQELNYTYLNVHCGLQQEKGSWTTALEIDITNKNYISRLIDKGIKMDSIPKITIDKIHQVKGKEADHVVVYEKCPQISTLRDKTTKERDAELRVWYVAVTRAKKGLHVIQPNKPHGHYMPLTAIGYGRFNA
jgi:superfamily I DNA/RNA helicase